MMQYVSRLVAPMVLILLAIPALAMEPNPTRNDDQIVHILETRTHPAVIELAPGGSVLWLNESKRRARISFAPEVAQHLTCEPGADFRLSGRRLRSGQIETTQVSPPCHLAPGEYEYRVDLRPGSSAGVPNAFSRPIRGKIVVRR